MRVDFLGTGGYYANDRRHTLCVMLPEIGLVFDAGSGFFRAPQRSETGELIVFLSHAHLDHVIGLTTILVPLKSGVIRKATVYAKSEVHRTLREHLFAELLFPVVPPCDYRTLPEWVDLPGGGRLTHISLEHPGGSTGYRIEFPDRTLAYITDTTVDGSYTDFIRGADLLIHECYFPDDKARVARETGHSWTTPVATLARDAGVGRLILVHADPTSPLDDPIDVNRARSIFPATDLAADLMSVDF